MSTEAQRAHWREQARKQRDKKLAREGKGPADRSGAHKDAVIYLRHAEQAMTKALRAGAIKRLDRAHLLALLALESLT
jgi:hypothetical protein